MRPPLPPVGIDLLMAEDSRLPIESRVLHRVGEGVLRAHSPTFFVAVSAIMVGDRREIQGGVLPHCAWAQSCQQ